MWKSEFHLHIATISWSSARACADHPPHPVYLHHPKPTIAAGPILRASRALNQILGFISY